MGNRIYGCDDCLATCPWNKFARVAAESALQAREDLKSPPIADWLDRDDATFRMVFAGSPIKRIGRDRFLRNLLIAAGNSGDEKLLPQIVGHLADPSPLVRAMAVWALARLASMSEFLSQKEKNLPAESDSAVRREWEQALSL